MVKEIKTATITAKGQIAIPKALREIAGFTEGTKVVIVAYEGHMEIRSLETMHEALQKTKMKEIWDNKEDEAWDHV